MHGKRRRASLAPQDDGSQTPAPPTGESLKECVNRWKHRWLQRVMYDPRVTSSEKCFAYFVFDCLNCVTLDAWPGQEWLASKLGGRSIKTMHRLACGLEGHGLITINRKFTKSLRYAPVFLPVDKARNVGVAGQIRDGTPDKNVHQSDVEILIIGSSATEVVANQAGRNAEDSRYDPSQRGAIELSVAALLGAGGFEMLAQLSELDDASVERLCRAYADGALGKAELEAAKLAAQQMKRRRRRDD